MKYNCNENLYDKYLRSSYILNLKFGTNQKVKKTDKSKKVIKTNEKVAIFETRNTFRKDLEHTNRRKQGINVLNI